MRPDALDEQLNRASTAVPVLLDGIADVEWLAGLDVLKEAGHTEGNTIHDAFAAVIDHLELDVLIVAANEFACSEIQHIARDEDRLLILRPKGVELLHATQEVTVDVFEHEFAIDVHRGRNLFVMDMLFDIFGQAATELTDVLNLHRQADSIGVPTKVL